VYYLYSGTTQIFHNSTPNNTALSLPLYNSVIYIQHDYFLLRSNKGSLDRCKFSFFTTHVYPSVIKSNFVKTDLQIFSMDPMVQQMIEMHVNCVDHISPLIHDQSL
jgi:hypothetical protein